MGNLFRLLRLGPPRWWSDLDIRHAVAVSFCEIEQGSDRILVIGADRAGRLLEVIVLDPEHRWRAGGDPCHVPAPEVLPLSSEVMNMPRTREQLEQAAADAERWLDELDPDDPTVTVQDTSDLRAIGLGLAAVAGAEDALAAAVDAARSNGRSWSRIAMVLGVSRQAAQKRYDRSAASVPEPR